MGLLLFVLLFLFLSFQIFVKDTSTTVKIETSNLVYRFTTTSCIVRLQMGNEHVGEVSGMNMWERSVE